MRKPRLANGFIFRNKALWWRGSSSSGRRRAFRRSSVPALPQNAVAFKNGYGPVDLKEAVATYERNFRAYREANGMKLKSWTFEVVNGATSIDYMDGRENITDMLKGRGFPLK